MERFLELSKKQVELNEKVENEGLQEKLNENLFLLVNEFVNKIKQYEEELDKENAIASSSSSSSSSERILHKEEINYVDFNFHGDNNVNNNVNNNGNNNGDNSVNEDTLISSASKNSHKEETKARGRKRKYYVRKKNL